MHYCAPFKDHKIEEMIINGAIFSFSKLYVKPRVKKKQLHLPN